MKKLLLGIIVLIFMANVNIVHAENTEKEPVLVGDEWLYDWGKCGSPDVNYKVNINGELLVWGTGEIDYSFFEGRQEITSIKIEEGITGIKGDCFWGCTGLSGTVEIPESVTKIGGGVFGECQNLEKIILPDTITSIGIEAFYHCENLKEIIIPENVKEINTKAFEGCHSLEKVVFKTTSLSVLPTRVFYDCYRLKSIEIPEGVKEMWDNVFYGCVGLETVTFPESLESIGAFVFQGCRGLRGDIVIPENVYKIGAQTFAGCKNFDRMIFMGDSCEITWGGIYGQDIHTIEPCITIAGMCGSVMERYAKNKGHEFEAIRHPWGEKIYVREENCEENGCLKRVCESCGEEQSEEVKALGHSYIHNKCVRCEGIQILQTPQLISISNNVSGVTVKWKAVEDAENYRIYRKIKGGEWSSIDNVAATEYTDKKAVSGKIYYYTVRCVTKDNQSVISAYQNTKNDIYYLASIRPSASNVSSGIKVGWKKIKGATGYYVYRSDSGKSYKKIATITKKSTVSYTDKFIKNKNGTAYTYIVKPYYKKWTGNSVEKKILRLTTPTLKTMKNLKGKKLKVGWNKNNSCSGYEIQYSTKRNFSNAKKIKITNKRAISKTITGLKKRKTYYIRIRSYRTVNKVNYYSGWSTKKYIKIKK